MGQRVYVRSKLKPIGVGAGKPSLTGGGKGNNMIYLSGLQDHKVPSEKIIEHIVGLVEKKAEQIRNQAL